METKYLSDGRKVVVIGQLNNVESIVQEIFVSECGDQIPSGEKFTTKSLHDEPVKSWKEKETEKYEARHKKVQDEINSIEKEMRLMKSKRQGHSDIMRSNLKFIDSMPDIDWEFFCDVMTGNMKWVTGTNYNWYDPKSFDDAIYCWDSYNYGEGGRYEGIKIISAFGVRESRMKFHVSTYSDGSGNGSDGWKFFKTDEDLKEFLNEKMNDLISDKKLTMEHVKGISKFITVDQSVIDEIKERDLVYYKTRYDDSVAHLLKEYNKSIKNLG